MEVPVQIQATVINSDAELQIADVEATAAQEKLRREEDLQNQLKYQSHAKNVRERAALKKELEKIHAQQEAEAERKLAEEIHKIETEEKIAIEQLGPINWGTKLPLGTPNIKDLRFKRSFGPQVDIKDLKRATPAVKRKAKANPFYGGPRSHRRHNPADEEIYENPFVPQPRQAPVRKTAKNKNLLKQINPENVIEGPRTRKKVDNAGQGNVRVRAFGFKGRGLSGGKLQLALYKGEIEAGNDNPVIKAQYRRLLNANYRR